MSRQKFLSLSLQQNLLEKERVWVYLLATKLLWKSMVVVSTTTLQLERE
jgi:hypothetical protein